MNQDNIRFLREDYLAPNYSEFVENLIEAKD